MNYETSKSNCRPSVQTTFGQWNHHMPCDQVSRKKAHIQYLCTPREFPKNVSAMFDNHTILLLWLKNEEKALFTWSRRTTCAKDHGLFYLNYPEINEVGKSDHVVVTSCTIFGSVWWHPGYLLPIRPRPLTRVRNMINQIMCTLCKRFTLFHIQRHNLFDLTTLIKWWMIRNLWNVIYFPEY